MTNEIGGWVMKAVMRSYADSRRTILTPSHMDVVLCLVGKFLQSRFTSAPHRLILTARALLSLSAKQRRRTCRRIDGTP